MSSADIYLYISSVISNILVNWQNESEKFGIVLLLSVLYFFLIWISCHEQIKRRETQIILQSILFCRSYRIRYRFLLYRLFLSISWIDNNFRYKIPSYVRSLERKKKKKKDEKRREERKKEINFILSEHWAFYKIEQMIWRVNKLFSNEIWNCSFFILINMRVCMFIQIFGLSPEYMHVYRNLLIKRVSSMNSVCISISKIMSSNWKCFRFSSSIAIKMNDKWQQLNEKSLSSLQMFLEQINWTSFWKLIICWIKCTLFHMFTDRFRSVGISISKITLFAGLHSIFKTFNINQ